MNIVTGYRGEAHVSSAQFQALNRAIFGADSYVTNEGSKMEATLITANEIHIADGTLIMQGVQAEIPVNTYESVAISNGSQGMNRNDLIVARYTKNSSTSVESVDIVVVEGTSTSGTASDPATTDGDIREGALLADFPLYRVELSGINVTSVTRLFNYGADLSALFTAVHEAASSISSAQSSISSLQSWKSSNLSIIDYIVVDNKSIASGVSEAISWSSSNVPTTSGSYKIVSRVPFMISVENASSNGKGSSLCTVTSIFSSGCQVRDVGATDAKVKVRCYFLYQKSAS